MNNCPPAPVEGRAFRPAESRNFEQGFSPRRLEAGLGNELCPFFNAALRGKTDLALREAESFDKSYHPIIVRRETYNEFRHLCREHTLAATHQRQKIYGALVSRPGHYSPEEIYEQVKQDLPSISLATVYRNLKIFVHAGMLQEVSPCFSSGHKDFTFVCPTKIAAFGKLNKEFQDRDAQILGGSIDSEFVHLAWRKAPLNWAGPVFHL